MNISVGGFAHTAWKMENGARLVFPSAAIVETQALGRGRIVAGGKGGEIQEHGCAAGGG